MELSNDLMCPHCKAKNSFTIIKQKFAGSIPVEKVGKADVVGISTEQYILKCKKCDAFIAVLPSSQVKKDELDKKSLDKILEPYRDL